MHDIDFGDEYDGPPACDPVPYVVRNRKLGERLQRELDETLRALPAYSNGSQPGIPTQTSR